jgi:predicted cytidylate kinase
MGSGKSTVAKMLAEKLGWPRYYIGGLRREKARERGLTLAEYNRLGETDPATDFEVDEYQKKLGETEDNFIIEGRTSWHFIPHSLKIYLDVDKKIAAKRIFHDLQKSVDRNEARKFDTEEAVLANILEREKSDRARYQKYYQYDVYDPSHYDFVLNTTNLTIEEAFEKIFEFIKPKLVPVDPVRQNKNLKK